MKKSFIGLLILTSMTILSCKGPASGNGANGSAAGPAGSGVDAAPGTFGYDLSFLKKYDTGLVVLENGDARLILSAKYQAKVFTSTVAGDNGLSLGWIHYKAFDGPEDAHMNAYGGENRLWLGPEGGRFSLFFPPVAKMEFANWKTPAAFDTEPWELVGRSTDTAVLQKDMQLKNYSGTKLSLSVLRVIRLLTRTAIDSLLRLAPDEGVRAVGYRTENTLTNTGSASWSEETGMPCIWMLDMFPPSASTVIVIPYKPGSEQPATTDYFGAIPGDRIRYVNDVLYFKADGKSRGKLGIHPVRARNLAGSYDAERGVLTIVQFDIDPAGKYLNQEWRTDKPPFSGDAVNAYNDGPLADGSQMGPFYELESVSSAPALAPGQAMKHRHNVFHFTGAVTGLDAISKQLLGVPLERIKTAF